MNKRSRTILDTIDWYIVSIYLGLVLFGLMNIYSVSPDKAEKQLIWILLAIILISLLMIINPCDYKHLALPFYIFTIFLLVGVLFFGKTINGAKAWYDLIFIRIQPSELSKISTALAISKIMNKPKNSIKEIEIFFKILIIIGLPIILILLQPDPGSVLVFLSFILVFYREGISVILIIIGLSLIFLFILSINISSYIIIINILFFFIINMIFFLHKTYKNYIYYTFILSFLIIFVFISPILFDKLLKPHHKNRIIILFKDEFDIKYRDNVGYNLFSSKAAIASGELYGKGFKKGTVTKGKFVPEQFTDYIFCTVAEEWGFKGGTLLIIIYLFLIGRIYFLSENQKDNFSRIFGYSVGSILLFHLLINMGMVMGLMPTIGIPLPFFSYGGSSLWAFTIFIFLFIRLNAINRSSLI